MASTFTTGFGIEKIGSGEQSGAWGTTTNHNLDIMDRIASYKAVALSGSTHTLTVREASPGSGTENLQDGMYRVIKFTGALGANNTVTIAPNTAPAYFIFENATTDSGSSGPYSVILTQGSGANITIQNGKNAIVYCDGAGSGAAVVNALSDLQIATLEVTGAAAIDGALTAAAITATTLTTSGIVSVDDTTTSTSGTTGSIHTDGGLGVAGTAFVAGTAKIVGVTTHGGNVVSDTDSTDDLGTTSVRWKDLFVDAITATDQVTATGFTGTLDGILGSGAAAAATVTTLTGTTITAQTAFVPDASDGAALGTTALEFSDLFLADGAVINLGDDQDVTITHVEDTGIALNSKDIAGVTSINAGPLGGRRNIIFNGDGAVNQRHGTAATTIINTYGPDRWRTYGGALGFEWRTKSDAGEGSGYYMRFQRTADDTQTNNTGIAQGLETRDSTYLAGQEITLSFRARAGANWSPASGRLTATVVGGEGTDQNPVGMTNTDNIVNFNVDMSAGSSFATFSGSGTVPSDKTQIGIRFAMTPVGTAGANDYFDIRNIQVEVGGTATTFEQTQFGEELARCQRYYYQTVYGGSDTTLAHGTAASATVAAQCGSTLPVTMRATPTLAEVGTLTAYDGSANGDIALSINSSSTTNVSFNCTASSLTLGRAVQILANGAGDYLTLTAEL